MSHCGGKNVTLYSGEMCCNHDVLCLHVGHGRGSMQGRGSHGGHGRGGRGHGGRDHGDWDHGDRGRRDLDRGHNINGVYIIRHIHIIYSDLS